MEIRDFYYRDLSFWEDLIYFGEAMQYAFKEEPHSDNDKIRQKGWIDEIIAICTAKNGITQKLIETFKKQNAEFLQKSPILNGLLDAFITASRTNDPAILKKIYQAFQEMQKDLPFEQNKEAYIDAGCHILSRSNLNRGIQVEFPISLYSGWDPTGQKYDDHRSGYLPPLEEHYLDEKEVVKLAETRPVLLEKSSALKAAYDKVVDKQGLLSC